MTDISSDISVKDILTEYLKLNNQLDMAKAVEKYCNDNNGIVFNKHPATNEKIFGDFIDYAESKKSNSHSSFISNNNISMDTILNDNKNEDEMKSFCTISGISYKPAKCVCYPDKEINTSIISIEKKLIKDNKNNNNNNKEILNKNLNTNEKNYDYELITPEGPGKFLKFVGENYMYAELKDGSKHCFPLHLVNYNKNYLKKHPLYSMNMNYKNIALNHTINILNGKNTNAQQIKMCPTKPSNEKDKFISFENDMRYLKKYLKQDELEEETSEKDYQIHLYANENYLKNDNENTKLIKNPLANPIKKNFYVHSVMNEYKVQKVKPYEIIDEGIIVETEDSKNKLCC